MNKGLLVSAWVRAAASVFGRAAAATACPARVLRAGGPPLRDVGEAGERRVGREREEGCVCVCLCLCVCVCVCVCV